MTGPGTSSLVSHDLTHLVGPLTEESLVKHLQARFHGGLWQTCIGPQLVCVNGFTRPPELRVLTSDKYNKNNGGSGALHSPSSPHTPSSSLPSPVSPLVLPPSPLSSNSSPARPTVLTGIGDGSNSPCVQLQHRQTGASELTSPSFNRNFDPSGSPGHQRKFDPPGSMGHRNFDPSGSSGHQRKFNPSGSMGHRKFDPSGSHDAGTFLQTRGVSHIVPPVNVQHIRHSSNTSSCSESQGVPSGPPDRSSEFLEGMVRTVLSQHADSFHPQVILVSGESGSGKTHCSTEVLRLLLEAAGGGSQTDAFKYLSAALTVVRAMGSALTAGNADSSRVVSMDTLTSGVGQPLQSSIQQTHQGNLEKRKEIKDIINLAVPEETSEDLITQDEVEDVLKHVKDSAAGPDGGFQTKEETVIAAIDLEDAYNRVDYQILMDRLMDMIEDARIIRWIASALLARKVALRTGKWTSEPIEINPGLPQGSPLSSVLFNIYTAGVAETERQSGKTLTFADDITVYTTKHTTKCPLCHVPTSDPVSP
ncbi:hypothetical protein EGW08_007152 [Elysia chlorotica]|uniref:Reverse transcriptase domain-containing protein n=1 Tax=Elysia chlorotica TaxID=188477 RepID=A0A433TU54_ELYCH|nr:hypothetical protein EGW08_007152 [Elysia chlorotica]